jgi:signal transduction histidine kinase
MVPDLLTEFRQIPELATVPEAQLQWLISKGRVEVLSEGTRLFSPGDDISTLRIILAGELVIYRSQNGARKYFANIVKGEITGTLPYSRMKRVSMEGIVAGGDLTSFVLDRSHFPEMISHHYELTEAMVHVMTDRVRFFTQQQQQDEKMLALGKLSAGLAHELNNPSAAVLRTAQALKKHLGNEPERFKAIIKIQTTDAVVNQVSDLIVAKIEGNNHPPLSLSERTRREDELVSWLEQNNIDNVYEIAENYTGFGVLITDIEQLKTVIRPEDLSAVLNWISQVLITERMVNEIQDSSRRINTLVSSIKAYTHMDQTPEKQRADVHAGIQSTLTMMNHKIKHSNVQVVLNFEPTLPQASILVSAFNQVWTNLIDNALDAMEGRPGSVLEIRTQRNREFIWVFIIDNGPGIPDEVKDRIFDPFFTTKPIGKGTGLGLEVVRQIVLQHDGKIDVTSAPGRTEFKVCFPIG